MEKAAFLGLGVMGANIARNLLNGGFPLTVYNRTVDRARELESAGVKVARSPKEAAGIRRDHNDDGERPIWNSCTKTPT